jgi:hypothetical protein
MPDGSGRAVVVPLSALRGPENAPAMLEDQFIELIDPLVRAGGAALEDGEEFREPSLAVLRYYRRRVTQLVTDSWPGAERCGGRAATG